MHIRGTMKNHKVFLFISLLSFLLLGLWLGTMAGCADSSKADSPPRHLASDFAAMIPEKITGKCMRWTDDSVLCRMSDTAILWCQVPKEGKPHCEVAVDWTPKAPDAPPTPEAPPKADAPKTPKPAPKPAH